MKKLLLAMLTIAAFTGAAHADEFTGLTLRAVSNSPIGGGAVLGGTSVSAVTTAYSNVTNFLGSAFANGGATVISGNTITKLVADDLVPAGGFGGLNVAGFTFSVANFGASATTARARVRFYLPDGAGGGPGTYFTGFSFNPIAFPVGVTLYSTTLAGQMTMPAGAFWAGMTFDNNTGGTGATAAQLDLLGQGIFNPPTVGSSADIMYVTTAAGSFTSNAPAGAFNDFGGNPVASFGWKFDADLPVPATPSTWGRVKSLYR